MQDKKNKMMKLMRKWLDQLVNEGKITKEQAWNELNDFRERLERIER